MTTKQQLTAAVHADHVHDFAISIQAGDVPADLMPALAQNLMAAVHGMLEDWLKDVDYDLDENTVIRLGSLDIYPTISYDGRRGCSLPHPNA